MNCASPTAVAESTFAFATQVRMASITHPHFSLPGLAAQLEEFPNDHPEAAPRFVLEFRTVWNAIPYAARFQLLMFWRSPGPDGSKRAPRFHLLATITPEDSPRRYMIGACKTSGRELAFHAGFIATAPADAVHELIAHEIAHAYLISGETGRSRFYTFAQIEQMANAPVAEWGFNSGSIARWTAENQSHQHQPQPR